MRIAVVVGHSKLKNGCITSADGTKMGGGNEYKFNKYLGQASSKACKKKWPLGGNDRCPENVFPRIRNAYIS